ncbi:MAG TPA: hypothetical protein VJZ91_04670, partial [Blastocatellia bacterium]|nr:hypothetical protein [Blastocatellia bacterium]
VMLQEVSRGCLSEHRRKVAENSLVHHGYRLLSVALTPSGAAALRPAANGGDGKLNLQIGDNQRA